MDRGGDGPSKPGHVNVRREQRQGDGTGVMASIERLAPGYFAAVMATGIISLALLLHGHLSLSRVFFGVAIALYAVLIVAYLGRLVVFPRRVWADLTDARQVFGYFTFVAGTDVLGTRFAVDGTDGVALGLGVLGVSAWIVLMYLILMVLLFHNREPIEKAINGGWLIATVSCESLAVLGAAVAAALPRAQIGVTFVAYAFWSLGVLLYLIFIAMIMYRFFFFGVTARDLSPPYWINMGAMAITTVAGSRLVLYPHAPAFLVAIRPFVQGLTIMLWAWGSWWIPFLILIGLWKYGVWRAPIAYEPGLWSIVFPLGMYTVACETLGRLKGLQLVQGLAPPFLWIAVAAWCAVAALFLWRWVRPRQPRSAHV